MRAFGFGAMVLLVLSLTGCVEVDIVSHEDGDTVSAGQRVEFRAQVDSGDAADLEWQIDGVAVAKGASFVTTTLAPGWHEVVAEYASSSGNNRDRVHLEVVEFTAIPLPSQVRPRGLARVAARDETWLITRGQGAWTIDANGAAFGFSAASGHLPSNDTRCLVTRGGEVWVGTGAGLARFDGVSWRTFTRADGLPANEIRGLAVDPVDQHVWVATSAGVARWDGRTWTAFAHAADVASIAVKAGVVWIGTHGAGLHRMVAGQWKSLPTEPGIGADHLDMLVMDDSAPRRVWVGGESEGVLRYRDASWERYWHREATPSAHGHAGGAAHPHSAGQLLAVGMAVEPSKRCLWIAERGSLNLFRRTARGLWARLDAAATLGAGGQWQALTIDPATSDKWLVSETHLVRLQAGDEDRVMVDLPDLVAHPFSDLAINSNSSLRELRLTNTVENAGSGLLDVLGVVNPQTQEHEATQAIHLGDVERRRALVGHFEFHNHPNHNHFHFDAFTAYQLREVLSGGGVGPVLAQAAKVSFCLMDFTQIGNGPSFFTACDASRQGISPGWADVYDSSLAGQSIPLAGIGPGVYWLVHTVTCTFAEPDYANNVAMSRVEIHANDDITVIETVMGAR